MSALDLSRLYTTIRRCAATLLDASYTDGIPTETTDVWRTIAADAARDLTDMIRRLRAAEARTAELEALVNAPELHDFASVPTAIISEEPARVRPAPTTEVARIAQDLTEECKRLAPELGAAVRHIADRRVRAAVADAAWLLEELGAA